jgi:Flp pilus assembly secretin CpaC
MAAPEQKINFMAGNIKPAAGWSRHVKAAPGGQQSRPTPNRNRTHGGSIMAYRILSAAALLVALAAPALAEDIRPNGPPLTVKVGAGTLIRTDIPIGNVFIADSTLADVQIPPLGDKTLVYVHGKKAGKTSLYALGDDGQVAMSREVDVSGSKTVRVLRGQREQIWSEAHGEPTKPGANLDDLPAGSTVSVPVGGR